MMPLRKWPPQMAQIAQAKRAARAVQAPSPGFACSGSPGHAMRQMRAAAFRLMLQCSIGLTLFVRRTTNDQGPSAKERSQQIGRLAAQNGAMFKLATRDGTPSRRRRFACRAFKWNNRSASVNLARPLALPRGESELLGPRGRCRQSSRYRQPFLEGADPAIRARPRYVKSRRIDRSWCNN